MKWNIAIFVWPWIENARTKQKQQTNGNRAIWLVYRTDTNACGFWLVKRTLGWKTSCPRTFALTSYCNTIDQCLLLIRVFFGGKTKSPCFDLFIHWLIKQITNTYRNHFSRSYENRSNSDEVWNGANSFCKTAQILFANSPSSRLFKLLNRDLWGRLFKGSLT